MSGAGLIRQVPRAPSPVSGVTLHGRMSRILSAGATPPSSLVWTHATNRDPPADFGFPYTVGLCRLLSAPAGNRSLPLLSPQSLCRCLDPYPAAPLRCSHPFLHKEHRPHLTCKRFGTRNHRRYSNFSDEQISGLQSFRYVQAPTLARPPDCSHRRGSSPSGRPGRLHHAMNVRLPTRTVASLRVRIG